MQPDFLRILEGYPTALIHKFQTRAQRRKAALPATLNGRPLQLVMEDLLLWDESVLTVSFKGGDTELHKLIADVALEWTKYANLKFDFGYNEDLDRYRSWIPDDNSSIRVGFQDPGYWSFVGTDSLDPEICLPGEITLNLEGFDRELPANWRATVLHEFGHALGFHHEHQSPVARCDFDWDKLYDYLAGPPNFWSKEQVDHNLKEMPAGGLSYSPHDKHSIMHYAFPDWMFISGTSSPCYVKENSSLSEQDKAMAGRAYPFRSDLLNEQRLAREDSINHILRSGAQLTVVEQQRLNARAYTLAGQTAMRQTFARDKQPNLEQQVKKAILIAAGQAAENPDNLGPQISIGNLLPTDYAYQFLADLLDDLVKSYQPSAAVRIKDVSSANTVLDCIQMVQGKL
jgi:hypothetical protein